jgi:hypothetical protein
MFFEFKMSVYADEDCVESQIEELLGTAVKEDGGEKIEIETDACIDTDRIAHFRKFTEGGTIIESISGETYVAPRLDYYKFRDFMKKLYDEPVKVCPKCSFPIE